MLKLLSCIFLGLSLVLWLATNFKATSCVDSDPKRALSMQNMQYHTSKVTNNRETVPEPPTTNSDGVEGIIICIILNSKKKIFVLFSQM